MGRAELRARAERLRELAVGLGKELALWHGKASPLNDRERRQYLRGIQEAVQGADDARDVLMKVEERLRRERERPS